MLVDGMGFRMLAVVDLESTFAKRLDLRTGLLDWENFVCRSVSHQPVPGIRLWIQIPQERGWIEDESADPDVACETATVPRSEFQRHETALRKSEKECPFWRITSRLCGHKDLRE